MRPDQIQEKYDRFVKVILGDHKTLDDSWKWYNWVFLFSKVLLVILFIVSLLMKKWYYASVFAFGLLLDIANGLYIWKRYKNWKSMEKMMSEGTVKDQWDNK